VEKLVPSLSKKSNYVVHYRNLQQYVALGLHVTAVHRVLEFRQSRWLEPYIKLNSDLRKAATNDFAKELFKLMNNSIYGKTVENLMKRRKVILSTDRATTRRWCEQPNLKAVRIYSDDLVAIEMQNTKVKVNKRAYAGFCVLELSKWVMYSFHYCVVKPRFGPLAVLLFTDTDSLVYHVTTDNIYADMHGMRYHFDLSDYDKASPYYDPTNKKVIGKFKDETNGKPVLEFVGLRPKMYSILLANGGGHKNTSKGICKAVAEKFTHEQYLQQLREPSTSYATMFSIRQNAHELSTVQLNKLSLCSYDDKRFICDDNVHTLAYGHYRLAH
jgi:hypothetical protein